MNMYDPVEARAVHPDSLWPKRTGARPFEGLEEIDGCLWSSKVLVLSLVSEFPRRVEGVK